MITFIRGIVHSFTADHVIIDNNGIGYFINFMHPNDLTLGETITIYTYQHFREDGTFLYGFSSKAELDLFEKLISVKGLGPKTALNMLAVAHYDQIIEAIENGKIDFLKKMPSIGSKTAQQIILDLKGKLVEDDNNTSSKNSPNLDEAIAGLKSLGYKASEINAVVADLKKLENASTDVYLKEGLKLLLKRKGG